MKALSMTVIALASIVMVGCGQDNYGIGKVANNSSSLSNILDVPTAPGGSPTTPPTDWISDNTDNTGTGTGPTDTGNTGGNDIGGNDTGVGNNDGDNGDSVEDGGALGYCKIATYDRGHKWVSFSKVKHDRFHGKDNDGDDDDVEGSNNSEVRSCMHKHEGKDDREFLAPRYGKNKVCMTQVACEQIINNYLQLTEGVLLKKPEAKVRGYQKTEKFAQFKAKKKCTESSKNYFSDDRIQSELSALLDYWNRH